jgi:hypothetical protein
LRSALATSLAADLQFSDFSLDVRDDGQVAAVATRYPGPREIFRAQGFARAPLAGYAFLSRAFILSLSFLRIMIEREAGDKKRAAARYCMRCRLSRTFFFSFLFKTSNNIFTLNSVWDSR